ncbi:uncharacterized protein LOC117189886 [Drosophila miranda]|uniref:uncharacterized protein LOC117189886 n=1 Tax=Drosophila miranda TaxID=7229 RepID=UPI00143F78AA|nr:uncharacterized protein LOC117189886 [Drosophila miranda]
MRLLLWYFLTCSTLDGAKQVNAGITNLDRMGFHNAYDEVVRGLIKSWESPIGYLQDAIMDRMERIKRQKKIKRDSHILGSNAMGHLPGEIHAMNQLDIMLDKIKPKADGHNAGWAQTRRRGATAVGDGATIEAVAGKSVQAGSNRGTNVALKAA